MTQQRQDKNGATDVRCTFYDALERRINEARNLRTVYLSGLINTTVGKSKLRTNTSDGMQVRWYGRYQRG